MIEKLEELQKLGLSLAYIERESKLGNGTLSQVLKTKKFRKTTEKKITDYYLKIIKDLVGKL